MKERRRACLWAGHVAVISMRLISSKLALNCCKNGVCLGLAIISLGSSSFCRKAETKWRTGRAILLLLCLCFSSFFLTSGKSASGIFLLLLCFSPVKNLSDVWSWNEFNFLLFGGCQTNTHTQKHTHRGAAQQTAKAAAAAKQRLRLTTQAAATAAQFPFFF